MDTNEIEMLAEAIVRKQAEAQAKREADAQAQAEAEAEVQAKAAAAQAENDRLAEAEAAATQAEQDRIADATQKRVEAVLTARVGDVFVDPLGAEHRVIGTVDGGVDTVSRDKDGGTIGNWRSGQPGTSVLSGWKKR